jgi:hypothetical protein
MDKDKAWLELSKILNGELKLVTSIKMTHPSLETIDKDQP